MTTEKLVVELEAKLGNSKRSIDDFEKSIDKVEKSTKNADLSLSSLASNVKNVAVAASGAVTALTAFVTITSRSRKELQLLASTANDSVDSFESTAFALKTFGLEASDTAQLLNDVTEAASEFANVGAGPFQDLADQLGLTKDEAVSLAREVKDLSGTDAMVKLINVVNDAELSFADSNQALKAISSDFQFLTPLVKENAAQLQVLADRYNKANAELALTAQQEKDLAALSDTSKLLTEQLGNAAASISANLAPVFNDFFNSVIEVVPEATNTIIDFFNTFQQAESINDINSISREIESLSKESVELEENLQSLLSGEYRTINQQGVIDAQAEGLSKVNERLFELKKRRDELIEQQSLLDQVEQRQGGEISGGFGGETPIGQRDRLDEIESRFKTEQELLAEKLAAELEIVGENQQLRLELEAEYQNKLLDLELERVDKEIEARNRKDAAIKKQQQDELKEEQKLQKEKISATLSYADAAISIGNLLFEDNKAIRSGLVIADTAAGIVRAFADLPFPAAVAASTSIGIEGARQLAAINSASKGGGSSSAPSAASSQDFSQSSLQDSSELSISSSDTNGSNQAIILRVEADDSDVANSINALLSNAKLTGTLK